MISDKEGYYELLAHVFHQLLVLHFHGLELVLEKLPLVNMDSERCPSDKASESDDPVSVESGAQ
jgi:hypothetical protein